MELSLGPSSESSEFSSSDPASEESDAEESEPDFLDLDNLRRLDFEVPRLSTLGGEEVEEPESESELEEEEPDEEEPEEEDSSKALGLW